MPCHAAPELTKSAIDALPTPPSDVVYWDVGFPGFGVKVTPRGRKVFVVLYRTGGARSKLRKYTIGPYGRVTLHQARVAAQKVVAAKLEGRDPGGRKAGGETASGGRPRRGSIRELQSTQTSLSEPHRCGGFKASSPRNGKAWAGKSIHDITKRDVVEVISAIEQRGAPMAADKTLKSIKTFLRWCVGRAVLDQSPAEGVPALPQRKSLATACSRTQELAQVILAARKVGGPLWWHS